MFADQPEACVHVDFIVAEGLALGHNAARLTMTSADEAADGFVGTWAR